MKAPYWESSAGALETLLETNTWVECDLYTYLGADGVTVFGRYTTADINITINGVTYLTGDPVHGSVGGTRPTAHWKVGLDVDSWAVRVNPMKFDPITGAEFPALLNNIPWVQSAISGGLDGSSLTVMRAYAAAWPTSAANWGQKGFVPTGVLILFAGPVMTVDADQGGCIITANDWRTLLDISMPRNLFTSTCRHVLFDSGCQLVKSSFQRSGSVVNVLGQSLIVGTIGTPPGSGDYTLGSLTMTSGANTGFSRFIRSWDVGSGQFQLITPLPYGIVPGDTFNATPGCNKTVTACQAFANYPTNWGGEQFIPAPETAV